MQDLHTFLHVREVLASFLEEDIGAGDLTTESLIPANLEATAKIICKSTTPAIVCGLEEAAMVFELCRCAPRILARDGTKVRKGTIVMTVSGSARQILKGERTALNLVMRMSGISTETRRLVKAVKGIKVMATRKTAPGLRYFDKKAVVVAGGGAHRFRLDDSVLIKDNHLALVGSSKDCVAKAREHTGRSSSIECEARNQREAIEAIRAGANIVMLDNFTPIQARNTIQTLTKIGLRRKARIEISGGVNAKNIRQYARAGPDFISLGSITHSPKAVDFSLEISRTF